MQNHFIVALCFAAALLLASCSENSPTIDASSVDAFQKSLQSVRQSLPEEQRGTFDNALMQLAVPENHDADTLFGALTSLAAIPTTPEGLMARLGPEINGKTGAEVLSLAAERSRERYKRQLSAVEAEIASLMDELAAAESSLSEAESIRAKIKVSEAKYYWTSSRFSEEPTLDFKISNLTDIPIRRVFFHGLLETPGRSVPWVDASFNYSFAGGIEPGETQHLKLAPNIFSDGWGNRDLKDRRDLVFAVTVQNFEDADGNRLVDVDQAGIEKLRKRLESLKERRTSLVEQLG